MDIGAAPAHRDGVVDLVGGLAAVDATAAVTEEDEGSDMWVDWATPISLSRGWRVWHPDDAVIVRSVWTLRTDDSELALALKALDNLLCPPVRHEGMGADVVDRRPAVTVVVGQVTQG